MRTLIIGGGEIGKSLLDVLDKQYECCVIDKGDEAHLDYEIMHVCFPYSENFVEQVIQYQQLYHPKYTVIHSTVPVGTSNIVGAVHSPCVGIHPHLGESLTTFKKFLGGPDASNVAQYFRRAGIKVYITDKSMTTELMKICSTSFYGLCIEWIKEVKRLCKEDDIPFEAWSLWTDNYNKGYNKLGYPEYIRPNLVPIMTEIGGHCVIPNLQLLDSPFAKFIKNQNE